jgi:hypothetical protein
MTQERDGMRPSSPYRVNLGGEAELPGVLNQQGPWAPQHGWAPSRTSQTLAQLVAAGHTFLICDNLDVSLPDSCADEILTNSVPIDVNTWIGPGVQSSEIRRILKSGGIWVRDGIPHYVKP